MGCTQSSENSEFGKLSGVGNGTTNDSDIKVESVSRLDEVYTNVIQREFRDNQQYFILNNILMSVQFFEDWKRDIAKLLHTSSNRKEKALNLLQEETVEFCSPDIVLDNITKNVRYRPTHGPRKGNTSTLGPKRLFIAYDRIEVVDSVEDPQYTSIDKPVYQVKIEKSKRKGFVRLQYLDGNRPTKNYTQHVPTKEAPQPTPSTSKDPDSEIYEYNTIYELKTPKPLEVRQIPEGENTLPVNCFTTKKEPISQMKFAEMKMQNEEDGDEIKIEDYFDTVVYIDSKGFMDYFKNGLFPNSLGRSLGFDEPEILDANAIPGKIFCNLTDDDDHPIPCEVIPCVSIPWQEGETYEFLNREDRPTITDTREGVIYRWPNPGMLGEIKTMNCVAVPNGFWEKKGTSPDATIEWEMVFPKAERYLEARMSHPQIKCYMFLLTLLKRYIEPRTQQHGLLPEHIRCHMFWECESNYRDWPDHRLGHKIIDVIKNLNQKLSKGELPDYFIRTKNLFGNIPKKYLQFAQKQFHSIITAPTMHFMTALRDIRYINRKFYGPLDFKALYNILTQPQGPKRPFRRHISSANPVMKPRNYTDRDTQIRHETELKTREEVLRRRKQKEKEEEQRNRKDSVNSIDLEWIFRNNLETNDAKTILFYFIKSYIQIAEDSLRLTAEAGSYLKQAFYLSTILERISPIFRVDASEFKESIYQLELASKKLAAKGVDDVPPLTPVRNSGQFDFAMPRQLKSNAVDPRNLSNSYSESEVKVKFQVNASVQNKGVQKLKSAEVGGSRKSVSFIEAK